MPAPHRCGKHDIFGSMVLEIRLHVDEYNIPVHLPAQRSLLHRGKGI